MASVLRMMVLSPAARARADRRRGLDVPTPDPYDGGGGGDEEELGGGAADDRPCTQCPVYPRDADRKPTLRVYGLVAAIPFQRARRCVEVLFNTLGNKIEEPIIEGMLDFEWDKYLLEETRAHGGRMWSLRGGVVVWDADYLVGDDTDLARYVAGDVVVPLPRDADPNYFLRALDDYYELLKQPDTIFVTMDFKVGDLPLGTIMFELYAGVCPMTCQNFVNLCKGECEPNKRGLQYRYVGSRVHRIVKDGWIQCGDVTKFIGGGGHSSFASECFPDERKAVSHDRRGVLSMCNRGPNTNQSQFFVTLAPGPWMDKEYVAFGRAVEGAEVLRKIESVRTLYETPMFPIVITAAHVLDTLATFWPSASTAAPDADEQRALAFASSWDAMMAPAKMPPGPPGLTALLRRMGPSMWEDPNLLAQLGPRAAEALAASGAAREAVESVIVSALEKTIAGPTAAKDAVHDAIARVLGPSPRSILRTAVDRALDKVALKRGGVLSIHDLRDVDSELLEKRFLEGMYSLTKPDAIVWEDLEGCKDKLEPAMAKELLRMLARKAAQKYPDAAQMDRGGPALSGTWTGSGFTDTMRGRWPWIGEGTVETVDARTGEPLGMPSVAALAYEAAEELMKELEPEAPVLQDPAKWAARVGEALAKRIGTAGKEEAKEIVASEIAEEVLKYVMGIPTGWPSSDQVYQSAERIGMLPEPWREIAEMGEGEEDYMDDRYPQQRSGTSGGDLEVVGEIVEELTLPRKKEESLQSMVEDMVAAAQEGSSSDQQSFKQSQREAATAAAVAAVEQSGMGRNPAMSLTPSAAAAAAVRALREKADAAIEAVVGAASVAADIVYAATDQTNDGDQGAGRRKGSVTARLFDVLLGTEFCPGDETMLAYSALIAQEMLKAIARAPPALRPDLQEAADVFVDKELPPLSEDGEEEEGEGWGEREREGEGEEEEGGERDGKGKPLTRAERNMARRIMDGAFQIAREVQIAAADVAFKYGVRTALPPEYLGYPPGDVRGLAPPPSPTPSPSPSPTPPTARSASFAEKDKFGDGGGKAPRTKKQQRKDKVGVETGARSRAGTAATSSAGSSAGAPPNPPSPSPRQRHSSQPLQEQQKQPRGSSRLSRGRGKEQEVRAAPRSGDDPSYFHPGYPHLHL